MFYYQTFDINIQIYQNQILNQHALQTIVG